ncbi:MAG TPA: 3-oxoacyl-ACP reductase [Lapillicoccus sp.]|nr:3-oxoacyl-ACP reductase [Lapillicoccus sp.]
MSDTYSDLVNSRVGKQVASRLGLPRPARLRRYAPDQPLVPGPVLVGGVATAPLAARATDLLRAESVEVVSAVEEGARVGAVVLDVSRATQLTELDAFRTLLGPALKRLVPNGRVVVFGGSVAAAGADPMLRATRRAVEGVVRSVGKELRAGATANLVTVLDGEEANADAALRFFLSGRSAYVDGQVVTVGAAFGGPARAPADWHTPLAGKVAVVTGAARGIGSAIADVLARDGATVVCVDVPAAGEALARNANRLGGTALQLDVTAPDAGRRIVDHARSRHGSLDVMVHNAGITRDKLLANMDDSRWASVVDVNLGAVIRMNEAVLAPDGLADSGHVVCVSSIAGIAGNRGQTNYAASKAGIVGLVQALGSAPELRARRITVNAVAPGFIETEMTARIPLATREVGRRLSSLQQGGLPVDVAETVAWLSQDANVGVTGNVVRVCGQSLLGA